MSEIWCDSRLDLYTHTSFLNDLIDRNIIIIILWETYFHINSLKNICILYWYHPNIAGFEGSNSSFQVTETTGGNVFISFVLAHGKEIMSVLTATVIFESRYDLF